CAADPGAVKFRHHPVEQSEARTVRPVQLLNGQTSILDGHDLVARAFQCPFQKASREAFVVRDQYSQRPTSPMQDSISGNRPCTSISYAVFCLKKKKIYM